MNIAKVQRRMQTEINDQVVAPMNEWLKNEYKSWKKNIKLLEKCRLDMNAAASALKSTPTDKKTEKMENTNERYNEVLQEVEQQLEQLPTARINYSSIVFASSCASFTTTANRPKKTSAPVSDRSMTDSDIAIDRLKLFIHVNVCNCVVDNEPNFDKNKWGRRSFLK